MDLSHPPTTAAHLNLLPSLISDSLEWFYSRVCQHMDLEVALVLEHFATAITGGASAKVLGGRALYYRALWEVGPERCDGVC